MGCRSIVRLSKLHAACTWPAHSVFPVELGYGSHRQLHDMASEYASFDIPVVVEIVDAAERVAGLVAELETMVSEGLVTVSPARVHRYSHGSESGNDGSPVSEASPPSHPGRVSGREARVT